MKSVKAKEQSGRGCGGGGYGRSVYFSQGPVILPNTASDSSLAEKSSVQVRNLGSSCWSSARAACELLDILCIPKSTEHMFVEVKYSEQSANLVTSASTSASTSKKSEFMFCIPNKAVAISLAPILSLQA